MEANLPNKQQESIKVSCILNHRCDVCGESISTENSISIYNVLDTCLECKDNLNPFIVNVANLLEIPNSGEADHIYITITDYSDEEKGQFLIDGLTKSNLINYPNVLQNIGLILKNEQDNQRNAILNLLIYKGMRIKLGIV